MTLLVALFLTPLFHNLPEATLGAVVIVAVSGMMNVPKLQRLYHLRKMDFFLALTALLGVLIFEVLTGLLIAVILSLLALIYRASQSKLSVLGRVPHRLEFSDIRQHPQNITFPGLLIIRPNENIFFANAASLRDEIHSLVERAEPPVEVVVLDLEMVNDPDVPAVDMIAELHEDLAALDVKLALSRAPEALEDLLKRSDVLEKIGQHNLHPRVIAAVLAHQENETVSDRGMELLEDLVLKLSEITAQQAEKATGEHLDRLLSIQQKLDEILREDVTTR